MTPQESNTLYRLHTVIMQEIENYHFRGQYDFHLRVRVEDDEIKFRYLNEWHPISRETLFKMLGQSNLPQSLYTKLMLRIVQWLNLF